MPKKVHTIKYVLHQLIKIINKKVLVKLGLNITKYYLDHHASLISSASLFCSAKRSVTALKSSK